MVKCHIFVCLFISLFVFNEKPFIGNGFWGDVDDDVDDDDDYDDNVDDTNSRASKEFDNWIIN